MLYFKISVTAFCSQWTLKSNQYFYAIDFENLYHVSPVFIQSPLGIYPNNGRDNINIDFHLLVSFNPRNQKKIFWRKPRIGVNG